MLLGSHTGGCFGKDVAFVGDVNGDGHGDVMATSTYSELAYNGGTAFLFNGPFSGEVMSANADAILRGETMKAPVYA